MILLFCCPFCDDLQILKAMCVPKFRSEYLFCYQSESLGASRNVENVDDRIATSLTCIVAHRPCHDLIAGPAIYTEICPVSRSKTKLARLRTKQLLRLGFA